MITAQMPTSTPRVDANAFASPYTSVAGEVSSYEMVDANFARQLETELIAANARVAELEAENSELVREVGSLQQQIPE